MSYVVNLSPLEATRRAVRGIEADIQHDLDDLAQLNDRRMLLNEDVAKRRELLRQYTALLKHLEHPT